MKRDLSLIRDILLTCEAAPAGNELEADSFDALSVDRMTLVEHIALLSEAGLLSAIDTSTQDDDDYIIQRMTWEGHEFLNSVRDDGLWRKQRSMC